MLARLSRSLPSLFALPLALAVAACGDNDVVSSPDAAATPDAAPAHAMAAAVSGDFNVTGVFSTLDVVTRQATPNALAAVAGGDPYLRRIGDELFIVNRDRGENITIIGGAPLALIDQYGTGGGSNPQDVAVAGGKLYVPALGSSGVVIINRATRAVTTLAFPAIDPDGKPDCVSALAVGTRVFVACGVLDASFTPRGPGKVIVIDSTRDAIEATLDLPFANPIGLITPGLGAEQILIETAPSFTNPATGCLAGVKTSGTPMVTGCVVTNAALGAYVNRVQVSADGHKLWMATALYAPDFSSQAGTLRAYDAGRAALEAAISPAAQQILDVATCPDGRVIAGDAKMGASGLRIYHDGVEETTTPISIGRPTGGGNGLACW